LLLRVHATSGGMSEDPTDAGVAGRGNALVVADDANGGGDICVIAGGGGGACSSLRRRQLFISPKTGK
jgi:hypothetical protein